MPERSAPNSPSVSSNPMPIFRRFSMMSSIVLGASLKTDIRTLRLRQLAPPGQTREHSPECGGDQRSTRGAWFDSGT
jgi:hypothetical protein